MPEETEVVFIGSCVVDFFSYANRFPSPGETLTGNNFRIGFGGKAGNSCVMAAYMGLKTAMITKIGTDEFGSAYKERLNSIGVNTDYITRTETDTMTTSANIFVTEKGHNSIVHVHGSSKFLDAEVVREAEENLFKNCKLVVITYEGNKSALLEGLRLARKYKATTYVNAAPINPEMDHDFYHLVDIFCANETEAEAVAKHKIESVEDVRKAAGILMENGCSSVILTLGERGAFVATQDMPEGSLVPCRKVTVKDTTGAGDAFNGAFAYNWVRHPELTIQEQVKRASDVASLTVQYTGTQDIYPRKSDIPIELL